MFSNVNIHRHGRTSPLYYDEDAIDSKTSPLLANDFSEENNYYAPDEDRLAPLKCYSMILGCVTGIVTPIMLLLETPLIRSICILFDIDVENAETTNIVYAVWCLYSITTILMGVLGVVVFSKVALSRIPFAYAVCEDAMERAKFLLCRRFALGFMMGMLLPAAAMDVTCTLWDSEYCLTPLRDSAGVSVVLTTLIGLFWYFDTRPTTNNQKRDVEEQFPLEAVTL